VNAVLGNSSYVNELGILLSNYRTLLFSNASYALTYVRRQANRVTHNLSQASILHVVPLLSIVLHIVFTLLFWMK